MTSLIDGGRAAWQIDSESDELNEHSFCKKECLIGEPYACKCYKAVRKIKRKLN